MNVQSNGGNLSIENLTGKCDGYDHPNIDTNGTVCLGNLSEGVAKLLAAYDFAVLAQVLIQFLRNYNEYDPYHRIYNWPMV